MSETFLYTSSRREDKLGRFLALAVGAHAAAAALIVLANLVFGLEWFTADNNPEIEVLENAVRVDVVGMPKFTVQELKNLKPEPASKGETKAPQPAQSASADSKSEVEFKTKQKPEKKIELSSLLNNLSSRPVDRAKRKKTGSDLAQKELSALAMEGNKVSKGQALVGDSLAGEQTEFARYVSTIPAQVRPYWRLPSYLLEKKLKARIKIYISGSGEILKSEIYETSGVKEFDQRALRAVKQTERLPAPDRSIAGRLAGGGVILGFPL